MDAIGKQIAAFYPAPNINTGTGLADSNNLIGNTSDAVRQDCVTTKFDYNINSKDKVYLRYTNADVQQRIHPFITANRRDSAPKCMTHSSTMAWSTGSDTVFADADQRFPLHLCEPCRHDDLFADRFG